MLKRTPTSPLPDAVKPASIPTNNPNPPTHTDRQDNPQPTIALPQLLPNRLDPIDSSVKIPPEASLSNYFRAIALREKNELPPPRGIQNWRHAGWHPIRKKIFHALVKTCQTDARIAAFADCGATATIYEDDNHPGNYELRASYCHDRLCTPCANARAWKIREALKAQMGENPHSFITLTLCGKGESLLTLVDRLYKHFRALRQHPVWAEKVKGGAAFLEIKYSEKAARWHPHLHIIADAGYIEKDVLSNAWRSISRDSYIVDISRIREKSKQVSYVTKYASKPLNTSFCLNDELLCEAVVAIKGRRLCLCFGSWYGTPLNALEESEDLEDETPPKSFTLLGSIDECIAQGNAGSVHHANAVRWILARLRNPLPGQPDPNGLPSG